MAGIYQYKLAVQSAKAEPAPVKNDSRRVAAARAPSVSQVSNSSSNPKLVYHIPPRIKEGGVSGRPGQTRSTLITTENEASILQRVLGNALDGSSTTTTRLSFQSTYSFSRSIMPAVDTASTVRSGEHSFDRSTGLDKEVSRIDEVISLTQSEDEDLREIQGRLERLVSPLSPKATRVATSHVLRLKSKIPGTNNVTELFTHTDGRFMKREWLFLYIEKNYSREAKKAVALTFFSKEKRYSPLVTLGEAKQVRLFLEKNFQRVPALSALAVAPVLSPEKAVVAPLKQAATEVGHKTVTKAQLAEIESEMEFRFEHGKFDVSVKEILSFIKKCYGQMAMEAVEQQLLSIQSNVSPVLAGFEYTLVRNFLKYYLAKNGLITASNKPSHS